MRLPGIARVVGEGDRPAQSLDGKDFVTTQTSGRPIRSARPLSRDKLKKKITNSSLQVTFVEPWVTSATGLGDTMSPQETKKKPYLQETTMQTVDF
jgi:hypothetical protein